MTIRARGAALQQRQQLVGQQEIAQVVEGEGHLDAVGAQRPAPEHRPGIVDQDVEAGKAVPEFAGEPADLSLDGEIGGGEGDGTRAAVARRRGGGLPLAPVATDDDHLGALFGQAAGGDQADAGGAAGHQADLPVHR